MKKTKLSIKEFHALKFGLDHPILPKKVKRDEIKTNIEKLAYSIKRNEDINNFDDEFRDQTKFEVNKFVKNSNRVCSTPQNKSLHRILDKLQKNDKIKICKYDKGRWVAILDKEDYFGKLDYIINDSSKFERINVTESKQHPVITKEASILYYVRKYFKSYAKNVIDQLIPSGSSPGKLCGRIKIHKKGNPARSVVSMINTPEYNLAKFLNKLIKPYLPKHYILDFTSHFIDN